MSHYTGLSLAQMTDSLVLPAPLEDTLPITGLPEGMWINLVSWAQDGRHIAFTVRSSGEGHLQIFELRFLMTCMCACVAVAHPTGFNVAGKPGDTPRQPLELWVADTATGQAHCLLESPQMGLNTVFDECGPLPSACVFFCCTLAAHPDVDQDTSCMHVKSMRRQRIITAQEYTIMRRESQGLRCAWSSSNGVSIHAATSGLMTTPLERWSSRRSGAPCQSGRRCP